MDETKMPSGRPINFDVNFIFFIANTIMLRNLKILSPLYLGIFTQQKVRFSSCFSKVEALDPTIGCV